MGETAGQLRFGLEGVRQQAARSDEHCAENETRDQALSGREWEPGSGFAPRQRWWIDDAASRHRRRFAQARLLVFFEKEHVELSHHVRRTRQRRQLQLELGDLMQNAFGALL